jgi:hypothetical protein
MAMLTGAVATVVAAGLLMWRHQAGLQGGISDAAIHLIEVEAIDAAEARPV